MEGDVQPIRYSVSQVKCPECLTDSIQTYIMCSECAGSARYEFSGKALQEKLICSEGNNFNKHKGVPNY